MCALDPGSPTVLDSEPAKFFEELASQWPNRDTVLRLVHRAGRGDVLTILQDVPAPPRQPSFTPAASVRVTGSFPALQ